MLLAIHPDHPEPYKVGRAVAALAAGEVIAYPTDTAYGLGCDAANRKAVDRLIATKKADRSHLLTLICPDLAEVARFGVVENPTYRVLRRFLPGPYCFILEATREVPKLLQTKQKSIGIRIPENKVILAVVRALGRPLISTTARIGTEPPLIDPDEIDDAFTGLGLVLDAGVGGTNLTTVIDLTKNPPEVVREGAGSCEEFR